MSGCGCADCANDAAPTRCGKAVLAWAMEAAKPMAHDQFWGPSLVAELYERSSAREGQPIDPNVTQSVLGARLVLATQLPALEAPLVTSTLLIPTHRTPLPGDWGDDFDTEPFSQGNVVARDEPLSASVVGETPSPFTGQIAFAAGGGQAKPNPNPVKEKGCCVKSFNYPKSVKPFKKKEQGRLRVGATFEVEAEFIEDDACRCSCCEFRQQVKYKIVKTFMPGQRGGGVQLGSTGEGTSTTELRQFAEDCGYWQDTPDGPQVSRSKPQVIQDWKDAKKKDKKAKPEIPPDGDPKAKNPIFWDCYGRKASDPRAAETRADGSYGRAQGFKKFPGDQEGYYPNKATKEKKDKPDSGEKDDSHKQGEGDCYFWMQDTPSVTISRGQHVDADYDFKGEIHDVCHNDVLVAQKQFHLHFDASFNNDESGEENVKVSGSNDDKGNSGHDEWRKGDL